MAEEENNTELEESDEIEGRETLQDEQIQSILESLLFATDRPQTVHAMKQAFKGTTVKSADIRRVLDKLKQEYASSERGVELEEVSGGYQLRTKVDNMGYLRRAVKNKTFKLSGPALEVLSIVAYKQPCIKSDVDEVRGVESGHLLRSLMEKGMIQFAGKSDIPGKPMLYATTKKFMEVFGLRSLEELPTLSEIDELIPEGIGQEAEEEQKLEDITQTLSQEGKSTYSEGEKELGKIENKLSEINTSSEFFEEEKRRQKEKREAERAQDIKDALEVGEEVSEKDQKWLQKYEEKKTAETFVEDEEDSDKFRNDLKIFNEPDV